MAALNTYLASVKGGFFAQYGTTVATIFTGSGSLRRRAAFALSRRGALRLQEVMLTLNGTASGSAASKTLGRIEASTELGGKRVVETLTLVSANTAAGDKTAIDADILAYGSYDSTPVVNLDGNPLGVAH